MKPPPNGDAASMSDYNQTQSSLQSEIDDYNSEAREILHQKYIIEPVQQGYLLVKKCGDNTRYLPWSRGDMQRINKLFSSLIIKNPFGSYYEYLSVYDNASINRQWSPQEIIQITELINS